MGLVRPLSVLLPGSKNSVLMCVGFSMLLGAHAVPLSQQNISAAGPGSGRWGVKIVHAFLRNPLML